MKLKALIHPITSRMRRKRFRFFMELIGNLPRPINVLDVGGTESYWEHMGLDAKDIRITLLNLEAVPVKNAVVFNSMQGNATDLSAWGDQSVDFIFSNSVVEHLYTWEQQQKMATEVQRVGRSYFIQTPNRYFPMEPHWLIPFFQFMPRSLRIALTRGGAWGHMPKLSDYDAAAKLVDEVRLLTSTEMKTLFPNAKIYNEYMFGMVKSVSAYHIANPNS